MANGNDLLSRLLAGRGLPQEEENMSVDPALSAPVPEMADLPEEEIPAPAAPKQEAPIPTAPTKEPAPPVKQQAQQVVEQVEAPDLKKLSESLVKTAEKAEKAEEKVPEKEVKIEQEDLADPSTLLRKYNELKKEFESKSKKAQWMDAIAGIANTVAAQLGTPTVQAASAAEAVQDEYKTKLNSLEKMYKTAKELKDAKKPKLMQVGAGIYQVDPETGMPKLVAGRSPSAEKGMTEYQRRMLAIKEQESLDKAAKRGKLPDVFEKELRKQEAKEFASGMQKLPKLEKEMITVDQALNKQLEISRGPGVGTGPIATVGGLRQYTDADLQSLEKQFRDINLKNMVSTFSGMSKAVDSDAERRAWESTQPSLAKDDKVNTEILLGMKSSLLKDKAVLNAQQAWVRKYGNLEGFIEQNPILQGKVATVVDHATGEMRLVPEDAVEEARQKGYYPLDEYTRQLIKSDYNPKEVKPPKAFKTDAKIEDFAKKHNLTYAKAEAILRRRGYGK